MKSDIVKNMRIIAGMITTGERISWGSDSTLLNQGADEIERLRAENEELEKANNSLHGLVVIAARRGVEKGKEENDILRAENETLRAACQLAIDMFVVNEINVPNTIETLQDALQSSVVNSKFTSGQASQAAKGLL